MNKLLVYSSFLNLQSSYMKKCPIVYELTTELLHLWEYTVVKTLTSEKKSTSMVSTHGHV